ncbi:MAG: SUMF1/EgtB/PvdO family nonheme iron enzyme [Planctomycetaceae bacterium]|nr:SUMF1/EgtB/PvdO family nonheme iron enzyme [Planctomycetaceae bacterium]
MSRSISLLILVSLTLLNGCGGGESGPAAPPPLVAPPPSPVSLTPAPAQPAAGGPGKAKKLPAAEVEVSPKFYTTRDFEVLPAHANFEIAPPSETATARSSDRLSPAAGENSSFMIAGLPPKGVVRSTLKLPSGFEALPGDVTESGWPKRIRCTADGMVLVLIPGGVTEVGTNSGPADCRPQHPAFVSDFYMDIHEVTVGQFLDLREQLRVNDKKLIAAPSNERAEQNQPALGVSFNLAREYAEARGRSLPTEAEWERAARGNGSFTYPWGEGRPLWSRHREPGQMDPVMSFHSDVSPFGVFDLAGNAREWCADWYQNDAFKQALAPDGSPRRDWTGPQRGDPVGHHVIKGNPRGWELWARSHETMTKGIPDVGFRCVLRIGSGAASSLSSTAAP